jgi:hypothetical protein
MQILAQGQVRSHLIVVRLLKTTLFPQQPVGVPDGVFARAVNITCPFRKSYPEVMVVQPRQDWDGNNDTGPLDRPTQGCILAQGQVRSHLIVVRRVEDFLRSHSLRDVDDAHQADVGIGDEPMPGVASAQQLLQFYPALCARALTNHVNPPQMEVTHLNLRA